MKTPRRIAIATPPCVNCRHWKPMLVSQEYGYDEIRLCWKSDMCHDFSCFEKSDRPKTVLSRLTAAWKALFV